jgi:hypothetical protein
LYHVTVLPKSGGNRNSLITNFLSDARSLLKDLEAFNFD